MKMKELIQNAGNDLKVQAFTWYNAEGSPKATITMNADGTLFFCGTTVNVKIEKIGTVEKVIVD